MACGFWFGTREWMQWIETPLSGADASPEGRSANGTLLNGYGYAFNSYGSHKRYVYSWRSSSSLQAAQLMKSYADGSYGRGKIYFVEPTLYDKNVLPARWADPSIGLEDEGVSLVEGVEPTWVNTSGWKVNHLPVKTAVYNLDTVPEVQPTFENSVFVPIPEGYGALIGAFYSATGTGGLYYSTVNSDGVVSSAKTKLTPLANDYPAVGADIVADGSSGILITPGKTGSAQATLNWAALSVRLADLSRPAPPSIAQGPWMGGMGHNGCEFDGKPTLIEHNGVDGGQVEFAASFIEVL